MDGILATYGTYLMDSPKKTEVTSSASLYFKNKRS